MLAGIHSFGEKTLREPFQPITLNDATTVADIYAPTVAELKKLVLAPLAATYDPTNSFNAAPIAQITLGNPACTPATAASCDIQVFTYWSGAYLEGGRPSPRLAQAAASQLPGGAFSNSENQTVMTMVAGGKSIPNPLNTPALVGAVYSLNSSGNLTNVRMGENRPVALRNTLDATGNISSAQNINAAGNLGAVGTLSAAAGRIFGWNQPTEGGVITLKAADGTQVHMEAMPGGTFRWVNGPWNKELASVNGTSGDINSAGAITSQGSITTRQNAYIRGGIVDIQSAGVAGVTGCTVGQITTDPSGNTLSCVNGTWTASSGGAPSGTLCGSAFYNSPYTVNVWTDPTHWAIVAGCQGQPIVAGQGAVNYGQCDVPPDPGGNYGAYTGFGDQASCQSVFGVFTPAYSSPTSYAPNCPAGYGFATTGGGGFMGEQHLSFACAKS